MIIKCGIWIQARIVGYWEDAVKCVCVEGWEGFKEANPQL